VQFIAFLKSERTVSITYGKMISFALFNACLSIITIARLMKTSMKHPAGSHCGWKSVPVWKITTTWRSVETPLIIWHDHVQQKVAKRLEQNFYQGFI